MKQQYEEQKKKHNRDENSKKNESTKLDERRIKLS